MQNNIPQEQTKWRPNGCLITVLVCLVLIIALVFEVNRESKRDERVIASVSIGTDMSRFDEIVKQQSLGYREVVKWKSQPKLPSDHSQKEEVIHTEYGDFSTESLGRNLDWPVANNEWKHFSGVITLEVNRGFASEAILDFTFIDGHLVKKEVVGYLPG